MTDPRKRLHYGWIVLAAVVFVKEAPIGVKPASRPARSGVAAIAG